MCEPAQSPPPTLQGLCPSPDLQLSSETSANQTPDLIKTNIELVQLYPSLGQYHSSFIYIHLSRFYFGVLDIETEHQFTKAFKVPLKSDPTGTYCSFKDLSQLSRVLLRKVYCIKDFMQMMRKTPIAMCTNLR